VRKDAGMTEPAQTEPVQTDTTPTPGTVPHGAWPSPISAADVARGGVALSFPRLVPTAAGLEAGTFETWWTEARPAEGGRSVVVRRAPGGEVSDLLPAPWNARSRVHEYGGQSWVAAQIPGEDGLALVFTHFADQRLYRLAVGADEPRALTPEPEVAAGLRYTDFIVVAERGELWCVRERRGTEVTAGAAGGGEVRHELVAVPLDGRAAADAAAVRVLAGGTDFVAAPRLSPDGGHLAWIGWDHPRMPWDGTELRVADVAPDGTLGPARTLLGGPEESVLQPEWTDAGTLLALSDRSGWWNLYRLRVTADGAPPEPEALCPRGEEFGGPLWQLGYRWYAPLDDGRIAVVHGAGAVRLGLLDPADGTLTDLALPYTWWAGELHASGSTLVGVAASPTEPVSVVRIEIGSRGNGGADADVLQRSFPTLPDPAYLPVPRSESLPGPGGRVVHAHVYPPRNPDVIPPPGELAPYVVFVHGGPTSYSPGRLSLQVAYFTSRGIGVVDVNYGGSTGYGRAYRERLRRQWGVVDVEDCVAAAQALVERGEADGARLAIRGGSAGGWTTLAALTGTDAFAAGTSYYGVAELLRFAEDTHDFESRYLDGLIGELPADREVYVQRAPLSHVAELSCPVLLLQGLDDEVVPPSQSELFRDALASKGIPHAYLAFEGESHGFRRAETVARCLEAELSFYGQVLGFDPPGVPRLPLVARQ
jgi:dipeptidyl aminopeptidase/acylaminoacyl peptidase